MKRRNVESSKYRKQFHFRKYKFAESMYTKLVLKNFNILFLKTMIFDD